MSDKQNVAGGGWFRTILVAAALGGGAMVHDQQCRTPRALVVGALCSASAVAERSRVAAPVDPSGESSVAPRADRAPAARSGQLSAPDDQAAATGQAPASTDFRDAGGAATPGVDTHADGQSGVWQRLRETRNLPYDGQKSADQAIGVLQDAAPTMAADPTMRAALRIGGTALDAGKAVDHVVGPNINRAAARVDAWLATKRP